MARKKAKRKAIKKNNKDMQVAVLLLLSVLSAILIYVQSGYIGEHLSPMLGGVIGWIKYIIPVGVFSIAISVACDKDRKYVTSKLIQYFILLICISVLITVFKGNIDVQNKEFEETVVDSYQAGLKSIGGGAIGAIVAYPLIELIDKTGTIILAIGVGIISTIFLYGVRPAEIVKNIVERRNEEKLERQEERKNEEKRTKVKYKENIEPDIEIKEEKTTHTLFGKKDKKQIETNNETSIVNEKKAHFNVDARINNTFVEAQKKYLLELKGKWEDFVIYESNANKLLLSYIVDTELVAASNNYAILVNKINNTNDLINENIESVEKDFKLFFGREYKLVSISPKEWEEARNKYIANLKNGYKYTMMDDSIIIEENTSELEKLANEIFGNNYEIK